MVQTSIIILTKNAGREFEKTLKMVFNQKHDDFEVLIIDSGSTDETLEIARRYPTKITNIKPEEFHHSGTRNFAASMAQGKYLVFITQDALPVDNNWVSSLLTPFSDPGVAGVYGGQIAYNSANVIEKFFYSYFYPDERISISLLPENLEDFYVDNVFLSDVNSVILKDVWEKHKFNEDIIMAEDKDWAIQVLKAGHKLIYEPTAAVYHSHEYKLISAFKRRFDDAAAMSQICGNNSGTGSFKKGIKYIFGEMSYVLKNKPIWLPYAILYDFVKFSSLYFGKKEKYLPISLKKRISKHSRWWENAKE
jgi:rhamnosyltransferase